jgi:RHS repeat-associated protein
MNGGYVALGYNDLGQPASKAANGVITHYLIDDLSPTGYSQVVEEVVSGAVARRYTYGLARISQDQVIENAWTPSFYQYDGRGTVRMLTNSAGAVTDTYEYDAFGNLLDHTGTTPNNYLYRGEQWDPDLSLYYLRARYMNPLTGRFLSRDPEDGDPASPASLHKYVYAGADPVNLVDPSGRASLVDYSRTIAFLVGTYTGAVVLRNALNCAFNQEGTDTSAIAYAGVYGQTAQVGPCTWQGYAKPAPPPPIPIPLPAPPPPPQKPPRCYDLNAIVDGIKAAIGASGGSCKVSLTPSQNYARLALWVAYLNARLDERAECSQWDPNPEGHKTQIDQIWTNIINCEVILHEF